VDLRVPAGWFFVLIGVILVVTGILRPDMRAPLTETNVNLYAGLVMLASGGLMLVLARRSASSASGGREPTG